MKEIKKTVLILGSGNDAITVRSLDLSIFSAVVCINNAWQIDTRWTHSIYPDDFPIEKRAPFYNDSKRHITAKDYVPLQNLYGGFVYAGGTMAFTAGYWALAALKPRVIAYLGCDMIYSEKQTHFYGRGTADPLRQDISLRNLEAKSCRLEAHAIDSQCHIINLSQKENSRLTFKKVSLNQITSVTSKNLRRYNRKFYELAKLKEKQCNYFVTDGKYWKKTHLFEGEKVDEIDSYWLRCFS